MKRGKKLQMAILLAGFLAVGAACSDSKTAKAPTTKTTSADGKSAAMDDQKVTELSYQLIEDGCDTEKHTFGSEQELCLGLQNEKLNLFCAPNARAKLFKTKKCEGTYSPFVGEDALTYGF